MKLKFDDIISENWFKKEIESVGTIPGFTKFWGENIYHRREEHEVKRLSKVIAHYERTEKLNRVYEKLMQLDTEFPELYCPEDDKLFVFLPGAYSDEVFRLSIFTGDGIILRHAEFDSKEDAVLFAAKEGCTEERPGMLDSLMDMPSFNRSLVMYEAQKSKMSLDEYLLATTDENTISLYQERIDALNKFMSESSLTL